MGSARFQWWETGDEPPPPRPLTEREKQVLWLASHGMRDKQIAKQLKVRYGTIKAHWRKIFIRLDLYNKYSHSGARTKAVAIAIRKGDIE